ncbi:SHOCT domain-containing protein [Candidatus Saccharibacteria bacterium]|nr:SHOCT domain-containing protein [Candidatus Saccharibacteria bacterium]
MPGLLRGMARTAVIAGTASAVSGNVQHKQQQKWAAQEAQQQQAAAPIQQPAASQDDELVNQLKQLAQLRDQGILTQEEFEAKKKQLLGI